MVYSTPDTLPPSPALHFTLLFPHRWKNIYPALPKCYVLIKTGLENGPKMVQKLVQQSNGLGVHWSSPVLPYACYLINIDFIDAPLHFNAPLLIESRRPFFYNTTLYLHFYNTKLTYIPSINYELQWQATMLTILTIMTNIF